MTKNRTNPQKTYAVRFTFLTLYAIIMFNNIEEQKNCYVMPKVIYERRFIKSPLVPQRVRERQRAIVGLIGLVPQEDTTGGSSIRHSRDNFRGLWVAPGVGQKQVLPEKKASQRKKRWKTIQKNKPIQTHESRRKQHLRLYEVSHICFFHLLPPHFSNLLSYGNLILFAWFSRILKEMLINSKKR